MDRIHLFDENRVILLSPRWAEFGATGQILLLILVCAVPLGLVFWLYRYEMKLVAARTARVLLCLRVLALVLLLLLVCLQPVYARITQEELPGRVILAIDVSESMHVADPQREPVDKLKLARALKLAGDLCSGAQLDDWIVQYEARKSVTFVTAGEFGSDQERTRREEAERRKAHDAVLERIDKLTRAQAAKQLLSADGLRFLSRLQAKHKDGVEIIAFAGDTADVKPEAINELFAIKDAPVKVAPKKDDKDEVDDKLSSIKLRLNETDLENPLMRAIERSGAKRGNVLGVVLLSDGQHRGGGSPVKRARELADLKVPLYPVALGSDKAPPDVSVVAITAPPTVFKEVEAPLRVRIRATGLKAQDLKVIVHKPGEEDKPLDQRVLKHDGNDQEYVESFQVRMDQEGRHAVQVTVQPQGDSVKEINGDNNRQSVLISVADDTSKVLLVDGEGRWEFHYLWQALLRDRSMKVKSVLFEQPRLGKISKAELEKLNHPLSSLPPMPTGDKEKDKDPLFDYDCIILGDVTPQQLPRAERLRLERYVADRGGTLVVLAGKRAMPQAFMKDGDMPLSQPKEGDAAKDNQDPLIKMLPIENPRVASPLQGFPVTLTEEGKQTEFMRLEAEGGLDEQLRRWAEMPPHGWGVIGKAKPGATTLAYVAGEEKDLKPEEKRKKEDENALFVRHNYGFGRVFFVGVDSTWRYRYRVGDAYHHRFWSQTIRWAASDRPLVTGNKFVRFGTRQAIFQDDEAVKLSARLLDEIDKLPAKLDAKARIIRKDGDKETVVALVDLSSRQFQERVLEGQVRGLPAGKYEMELVIPELADKLEGEPGTDGKAKPIRATFTVSPGENGELIKLAADMTLLKDMADKNGTGKVYTPETANELIEKLTAKGTTKKDVTDTRLYSWWLTLVVILSLLTVEWVLRKWAGLP